MQLPLLEDNARFSCGSCTACCNQPWRTMIEADRAAALDRHDWSRYPALMGRRFYQPAADGREGYFDLAKGEGTKCLFLDTDGLCIIHKELGPDAKPKMCRQFPYLPSRTWTDDRISLNFGCPSVQKAKGDILAAQREDILAVTPLSTRPHKGIGVRVPLTGTSTISHEQYESALNEALRIFGDDRPGDVWSRFEALLCRILELFPAIAGQAAPDIPSVTGQPPQKSPMPARLLFAATLYPDTISADKTGRVGFFKRFTLLPRLMSLAQLRGVYASRLLARNIAIDRVVAHPVAGELEPAATRLLLRYFRSRFWLRNLVGTRLPVIAGIHQHIHDFNAILFLARAEAEHQGADVLSEGIVRKALTCVEFHLANQSRLYEQTLKGYLRGHLCDARLAFQSLRLMAPQPAEANLSA